MELDNRTRVDSFDAEEISTVDDMTEWKDDNWDSWVVNCKRPDKIPDPANPGQLITQDPFPMSVKSIKRLTTLSLIVLGPFRKKRVSVGNACAAKRTR